MAIAMQGNWTIRVKSKKAVYGQRFVIAGGTSADGVCACRCSMISASVRPSTGWLSGPDESPGQP